MNYKITVLINIYTILLIGCNKNKTVSINNGIYQEYTGIIQDIDGNIYKVVKICNKWWMAENLRVTHYRNLDPIPNVTNNKEWDNLNFGAYCNYENEEKNVSVHGRLYNWYAVNDSRKIAPEGWHIPNNAEFIKLRNCLGFESIVGGLMKESGITHWNDPNTDATNESDFSAYASGSRTFLGMYSLMGYNASFWSASEVCKSHASSWNLYYNNSGLFSYSNFKQNGFSIRCIRD